MISRRARQSPTPTETVPDYQPNNYGNRLQYLVNCLDNLLLEQLWRHTHSSPAHLSSLLFPEKGLERTGAIISPFALLEIFESQANREHSPPINPADIFQQLTTPQPQCFDEFREHFIQYMFTNLASSNAELDENTGRGKGAQLQPTFNLKLLHHTTCGRLAPASLPAPGSDYSISPISNRWISSFDPLSLLAVSLSVIALTLAPTRWGTTTSYDYT